MKPVRFLEEAQGEFLEQIAYYEERQNGLGDRGGDQSCICASEARSALEAAHPSELVVFAVAHFKRRPTYWRRRT